jgi:hypothetical protein
MKQFPHITFILASLIELNKGKMKGSSGNYFIWLKVYLIVHKKSM